MAAPRKNRGKSYEELLIQREFDLLEVTVEVVGEALLAEIERLRALLRQLPPRLGITEKDITGRK